MTEPLLIATHLSKSYTQGQRQIAALHDATLAVQPGEFVALVGRSGSGKSTLLALLGGLDRPDTGAVTVAGTDVAALSRRSAAIFRRRHVGFLFQTVDLLPTLTALENIMLPCALNSARGAASEAACREQALALLRMLGVEQLAGSLPDQLSGGERQRVGIARALVNQPDLILADEPTGSLDHAAGQQVVSALRQAARDQQTAVLLATHDEEVAALADRVLTISDGRLEQQPVDRRLPANLLTSI